MATKKTAHKAAEWPPKGFSKPAERALATIGVTRLSQLAKYTEKEIANLHGMGPKGIRILKSALKDQGLAFKPAPKK